MKKCIYCGCDIPKECVIDFCEKCGLRVWGPKMFNAIVENMEAARAKGDLCDAGSFSEVEGDFDIR